MKEIQFDFKRDILMEGFDGNICRIHPRQFETPDGRKHITYSTLLLSGSDVFMGNYVISSVDGFEFSEPQRFDPLPETMENGIRTVYQLNTYFHKHSQTNYCLGRATRYINDKQPILSGKDIMPALTGTFDSENLKFVDCERLDLEFLKDYDNKTFMEPLEQDDGTVLVPAYVRKGDMKQHRVVVVRFKVENGKLKYLEHGGFLVRDDLNRGMCEPRLAKLKGKYYLTMRSDETCLMSVSDDGLNFTEPAQWYWDDGEPLTSRNTQQAWVSHKDGLFLVYTRETQYNKHIFRRRAPLFMARFNEDTNRLVKDTEVILVPEMGARLGNFTATDINENESWVSVSEWMQTTGPDPTDWRVCVGYGARNRLWRVRIIWK